MSAKRSAWKSDASGFWLEKRRAGLVVSDQPIKRWGPPTPARRQSRIPPEVKKKNPPLGLIRVSRFNQENDTAEAQNLLLHLLGVRQAQAAEDRRKPPARLVLGLLRQEEPMTAYAKRR